MQALSLIARLAKIGDMVIDGGKSFSNKLPSAMRNQFGGHEIRKG